MRKASGIRVFFVAAALALAVVSQAPLRAKSKKQLAAERYRRATTLFEDLRAVPPPELGARQYRLVTEAFRKVHRTDPSSGYCDDALFNAASVQAEMAARFESATYRAEAVRAYRFLIAQYPHSRLLGKARAEIARLEAGEPPAPVKLSKAPPPAAPRPPEEPRQAQAPQAAPVKLVSSAVHSPGNTVQISPPRKKKGVARVTGLRFFSQGDSTRVIVELDDYVKFKYDHLTRPRRLYFDLFTSRLGGDLIRGATHEVNDGLLKRLRIAQNRRNTARVVLELERSVYYDVSWLPNPPRLVIQLRSTAAPAPKEMVAQAAPPASGAPESKKKTFEQAFDELTAKAEPAPPAKPAARVERAAVSPAPAPLEPPPAAPALAGKLAPPPPPVDNAAPPKPALATSRGKRSLIRALGLKTGRIVIDAGHGGHDAGSIGRKGLREKDLVLDIAIRLGALIEQRLGVEVIYTRSDDRFLSLKERIRIANSRKADLFVSVHANSSSSRKVRGVETYYLNFTSDPWALKVASRENAAASRSIHELQDLLSKIARNEKIDESREFAVRMQKALYAGMSSTAKGLRNRGVRKAPFMVLIGAKMPAVLAEIGFLSNSKDEKLLKGGAYRQKVASFLYDGVAAYVNTLSSHELSMVKRPAAAAKLD